MRRIKTAAEREAQQERNQNRYERIHAEVTEQRRAEWAEEFGADAGEFQFPALGEYTSRLIHEETVRRIALEFEEDG